MQEQEQRQRQRQVEPARPPTELSKHMKMLSKVQLAQSDGDDRDLDGKCLHEKQLLNLVAILAVLHQ